MMDDHPLADRRSPACCANGSANGRTRFCSARDAFDGGAEQGWEQVAWVGTTTARRALAIALTGMMRDGEITRDRAQALARMVLRENAAAVYGLPK